MTSVFLSYDRDDTERARPVALAMEKAGHTVWWDLHIRGGEQFSKVIDEALKAADAVVVLWSKNSIESPWVRDEAAAGRDTGRLVPVSLDDTELPLGFRQFQTIDLSKWKGRGKPPQLAALLSDVAAMARPGSSDQVKTAPPPISQSWSQQAFLKPWMLYSCIAIAVVLFAGALWWMKPWSSSQVPSVAIEASDPAAASRSLAQDLFVKLGSLQASNADAVQLVGADSDTKPTLIFEVSGDAAATQPHASLVLLSGRDRSLFWSKEFSAPTGRAADLKQQLSFTAARIIGCAVQGLNSKERLSQEVLRLHLNACAAYAETAGENSAQVVPMFRRVTKEAPGFDGGWAGLLLAETEVFMGTGGEEQVRSQLKKDVEAARKVNPDLIEIYQADIDLLPYNAFSERLQLAERAVKVGPDKPLAYAARAGFLQTVGRMVEAVIDAQKAVQLDPMSPPMRDQYIQMLLYAGRTDSALQELEKAERLWPGASNLEFARFRINLRYGDAREALRVAKTGEMGWAGAQTYLEARIDPSPAKVEKALDHVRGVYRQQPYVLSHLAQVYGEFDREKDLLELMLRAPDDLLVHASDVMFRPALVDFWNDPRSLLIAKRIGFLQFWQSSGKWPDFCRRPDLPYDCKKEAARLLA